MNTNEYSIENLEKTLQRILIHLAKNPKNKWIVIELADIFNTLLTDISQKEMDLTELGYNIAGVVDDFDNLLDRIKTNGKTLEMYLKTDKVNRRDIDVLAKNFTGEFQGIRTYQFKKHLGEILN